MPAIQTNVPRLLSEAGLSYTAIPNALLDYWLTRLTPGELAVMLYLYRHTLGYQKLSDRISYDQFLRGITTREGQRLDSGAGVSRRTLVTALASLEKRGLLRRHQPQSGQAVLFEVCLEPFLAEDSQAQQLHPVEEQTSEHEQGQNLHPIEEQKDYPTPVQQLHPTPVQKVVEAVQKLPVEEAYSVQNNSPTKEKLLTQNINRSGEGVSLIGRGTELLEQTIPGLTRAEAQRLADTCLRRYGRDLAYLQNLAEYVQSAPGVRNPAALLTSLIQANAERQAARPALYQPTPRPAASPVVSDFGKYRDGKYAYLTRPRQPLPTELSQEDYQVAI